VRRALWFLLGAITTFLLLWWWAAHPLLFG